MSNRNLKLLLGTLILSLLVNSVNALLRTDHSTEPVPFPRESATGILFSGGASTARFVRSITLLTPEWVITTLSPSFSETEAENLGNIVTFIDERGFFHVSTIDQWIPDNQSEEFGFKIAFGHLRYPIKSIAPPELDLSHSISLVGQEGIVAGHEWKIGPFSLDELQVQEIQGKYLIESELYEALPLIPKSALKIRLESHEQFLRRNIALHFLDNMLATNPPEKPLSFPIDPEAFGKQATRELREELLASSKKIERARKQSPSKTENLWNFLYHTPADPRWAGKELFSKSFGVQVLCPKILRGEGFATPFDSGAGVYTWHPEKQKHLLSGIILNLNYNPVKYLKPLGFSFLFNNTIVPISYIYQHFCELCLNKAPHALPDPFDKSETSKTSTKPSLNKKKRKKKKQKSKNSLSPLKSTPETQSVPEEDTTPAATAPAPLTPPITSETPLHPTKPTLETQEIITREIIEPTKFSPKIFENTNWSGIVCKQKSGRGPYKELYTFRLKENNTCTQEVALLRYAAILEDHIAYGTWEVLEQEGRKQLVIRITPPPSHKTTPEIIYLFDINPDIQTQLILKESDASPDLNFYRTLCHTKTRQAIILKKDLPGNTHTLRNFTFEETYEGIYCELFPSITLARQVYSRSRSAHTSLNHLLGTWFLTGAEHSLFADPEPIIIEEGRVLYRGNEYRPTLKYVYDIWDNQRRRLACLNLQPIHKTVLPVTLGIYVSPAGEYILSTHRVSYTDYTTRRKHLAKESKFYKRTL